MNVQLQHFSCHFPILSRRKKRGSLETDGRANTKNAIGHAVPRQLTHALSGLYSLIRERVSGEQTGRYGGGGGKGRHSFIYNVVVSRRGESYGCDFASGSQQAATNDGRPLATTTGLITVLTLSFGSYSPYPLIASLIDSGHDF